jgi:hypothetical protein
MLGMLRRARERREAWEASCPCNQTCRCHKPEPGISSGWGTLLLLSPIILFAILALLGSPPPQVRTIHVGSKICDVVFVKTGQRCNGHGGQCEDEGYDKAVSCR